MSVLLSERETYEQMWAIDAYATHSPGEVYVPAFLQMAKPEPLQWVLDAGTGSGKGALALRAAGFKVLTCDITPDGMPPDVRAAFPFNQVCLWDDLLAEFDGGPGIDWVYCCDVMEHIPPTFTMLTVHRLLDASRNGVFFSIALQADSFGAWVGKPLHQTVQDFSVWRDQLNEVGHVQECRDLLTTGLYLVTR